MNLIKQNQIYDEIASFYSDECKVPIDKIIEGEGSNRVLLFVFVHILKRDLKFNTQFVAEKINQKVKDVFAICNVVETSKKTGGMYVDTYDYAREKILNEFPNE
tara:strand:- start:3193 stop:3504 length:312 start_codon:yes stop_codon:yes gene_type:complete